MGLRIETPGGGSGSGTDPNAIYKDGSRTWTANQPVGNFIFTDLGAGSASGHSVNYDQLIGVQALIPVKHDELTELGDDDHTQYVLANGTRDFSGDQSIGNNNLTNLKAASANHHAVRKDQILIVTSGTFPVSPSNGDVHFANNVLWVYDSAAGEWLNSSGPFTWHLSTSANSSPMSSDTFLRWSPIIATSARRGIRAGYDLRLIKIAVNCDESNPSPPTTGAGIKTLKNGTQISLDYWDGINYGFSANIGVNFNEGDTYELKYIADISAFSVNAGRVTVSSWIQLRGNT